MKDSVDAHVARWVREMPGLNPRTESIVARLSVITRHLSAQHDHTLTEQGLAAWEYQTLKDLRRRGAPYRATPTQLAESLRLSPAAVTKRLTALESAGHVRRSHDIDDRRRVFVTLTTSGRNVWERNIAAQERVEIELLDELTVGEQDQLNRLLRKLVLAAERPSDPPAGRR